MADSTTIETEKTDAKVVTDFCKNLRNGTSVLQKPNANPCYAKNSITGNVPQGLGQYTIRQGQFEQGKKSTLFVTMDQANKNDYAIKKGSHSLGALAIRNVYGKDDILVQQGKAKVGEVRKGKDGKEGDPFIYVNCFASEDVIETKLQAVRDEEGNAKRYEKDIVSETDVYKEDKIYHDQKDPSKTWSVKAGDPVILHKAGSIIMERVPTDKAICPAVENNLPAITSSNLYPLPKPKNTDFRETLKCELAEVFRGIYNGNGNGWKPTIETIDKIEKEFGKKPGVFSSILAQADTYGRGNTDECKRMEANISAKIAKNQEQNTNVNVNTKHKGRQ
jgi:hypothetical protein